MGEIKSAINGEQGFLLFEFEKEELQQFRKLVMNHWANHLKNTVPELHSQFEALGIEKYHELADKVNHGTLWPKMSRILPKEAVPKIRALPFFKRLEQQLGPIEISDEENVGFEEIYWRLVRPNKTTDIGPMHADRWFWDLGHGTTPPGKIRVKIWVPLFCEPGLNGLKVVPGSHLKQWKYHGEMRDGFVKPVFDEKEEDLPVYLVPTKPGQAIVFNDELLHGGAVNRGQFTRVSAEFTLFVNP